MFSLSSPNSLSKITDDSTEEELAQCVSKSKVLNTILIKSIMNKKVTILSKSLNEYIKEKQYSNIVPKVLELPDFQMFDLFHEE